MKLECKTTFLHGRDRYDSGDLRSVDDELGRYFIEQGWATAPGSSAQGASGPENVTLDVQSGRIGTGDSNG